MKALHVFRDARHPDFVDVGHKGSTRHGQIAFCSLTVTGCSCHDPGRHAQLCQAAMQDCRLIAGTRRSSDDVCGAGRTAGVRGVRGGQCPGAAAGQSMRWAEHISSQRVSSAHGAKAPRQRRDHLPCHANCPAQRTEPVGATHAARGIAQVADAIPPQLRQLAPRQPQPPTVIDIESYPSSREPSALLAAANAPETLLANQLGEHEPSGNETCDSCMHSRAAQWTPCWHWMHATGRLCSKPTIWQPAERHCGMQRPLDIQIKSSRI